MSHSLTTPSLRDFQKLARAHTLVPVTRTVAADLETPVSAFLRVAATEPEAFLLESVEGGERVRSIEHLPSTAADELHVPDAHLMFFDEVLAFDHVKKAIHLIITTGTRKRLGKPTKPGGPHLASEMWVSAAKAYADATRRLDRLEKLLSSAIALPKPNRASKKLGPLKLTPRTPARQFLRAVDKIKNYITAGDVFQCVLSQRFDCTPGVDAFEIYRSLRIVNPSPYMYFIRSPKLGNREQGLGNRKAKNSGAPFILRSHRGMSGVSTKTAPSRKSSTPYSLLPTPSHFHHIVGSSPEMLVRVHNGIIEYRPIAGSRPRGADEAADIAFEASLRADAKEVAEHVMLVDLGRNDVGRVSEFGSVKVKELMFVERYSHIMHLVSALQGTLRKGLAPLDALRACFPAGTLSGAPKIRAMEIIEELEPARRGVYGGAIIYADFNGNLDSCIAIRTLFMDGETGHIQAGAGIVADSIPQKEHEECGNKAKAVVRAIERARAR
jgi:anthranilate synthase component 1